MKSYIAFYNCNIKGLVKSFVYLLVLLLITSCKKSLKVDAPVSRVSGEAVYKNDVTAASVLTGIYSRMSTGGFATGVSSISVLGGTLSDELRDYSTNANRVQFYTNSLKSTNPIVGFIWAELYRYVYTANDVIEGVSNSSTISPAIKDQLIGEAKFLRAFSYFYLVNLYGDVPLILSTDYTINSLAVRASSKSVYEQVITDLKAAQSILGENYTTSTGILSTDRVRPNKWAVTALLARAYLYNEDWRNAELQSSLVINQTTLYDTIPLAAAFLKNTKEQIWQLQPTTPTGNTLDGNAFILAARPGTSANPVALASSLLSAFESGDRRKSIWTKDTTILSVLYSYPYKYKVRAVGTTVNTDEYLSVLRMSEQYLIRAEARIQQDNLTGAAQDLNLIRAKAGLLNSSAADKVSMLSAIERERRVELFAEWGHRWFDIKRTGRVNSIMSLIKGSNWQTTDQLFPIPQSELKADPNLVQNPSY